MAKRIYNYKFENKESLKTHPVYKIDNKFTASPPYYFITDKINCPILDQETIGSCVANGSYALFYIISSQIITLSRLQLYYISRSLDGSSSNDDAGTYLSTALKSIIEYGLCNENTWPYDISKFADLAPTSCFCDTYSLKDYTYSVVPQDINSITNIISNDQPVLIGIAIYSSFEFPNTSKTGVIPLPDTKREQFLGGHALLIVGYDNSSQYFKVQNSWGTEWGASGYCFIPYAYILSEDLTSELFTVSFKL
jgi:C1A family cysteine protease